MAVSELGLSIEERDDITPRALTAMIVEWKEIQIYKAQVQAHIANGGNPDDLRPRKIVYVNVANIL
jgi:hypothetical protein